MEQFIEFITKKEVIGTVITLFTAYISYHLITFIADKFVIRSKTEFERKRKRTVISLLKAVVKWLILLLAAIIILDMFGINVSSIVASLGIASAVGALSFQDTLKDIISGSAIIMDNYFVVGDFVRYNDFTGQIIEFGLKSTKIMNVDGEVLVIANRNISEVVNLSQKTASALIKIPTAYEEKSTKVDKVLNEVLEEILEWETVNKTKTAYLGIVELSDSAVIYGIRIYCSPGQIWSYKWATLRLIKEKYEKHKIKIPYNQIEVHNAKRKN